MTAGGFMTSCGYRAAKTRSLSHWAIRDQVLGFQLQRLHAENYGVRKIYYLMRWQGCLVGGDQLAFVDKTRGISKVSRGKPTFTNQLKTTDTDPTDQVTHGLLRSVRTGCVWRTTRMWRLSPTCLSRKIVGWSVSSTVGNQHMALCKPLTWRYRWCRNCGMLWKAPP